ncbi:MAG: VacJ family lipoprotein [Gammaproteobacteria bacterium]|nr:MAG: VacJ family lipoprotein [Gammaproteobacteria bacterium]
MSLAKISLASIFLFANIAYSADEQSPDLSAPPVETSAAVESSVDPWEKFNRSMFSFNEGADKYFLKPVTNIYIHVTPKFFRRGVDNALSNIMEIPSALNGILQGNLRSAGHDTGRLLVNSTLGLAGILDVAQYMNLKRTDKEDFGQTLAVWGVGSGPYVVLPLLGPSNLRDTSALPADWYSDPKSYIDDVSTRNTLSALSVLNLRESLMPLEKNITGDKYVFFREAYLQHRNFVIKNGKVEDSFGDDEEEDSDSSL